MKPKHLLQHYDRIADAPDAIPKLRQFILELAVRGKLVDQDPKDEPAFELLKRIQAEKARLVKAGETRKEKSLPVVKQDEAPFDAPAGWEWVRIREVTGDRGQVTPTKAFTYIDVTAINKEVGRVANAKVLSANEAPSRARKLVQTDDVLYSCVRPYLLNIAIIDNDIIPSPIASTAFAVLNGFGLVLPKYLWTALRSPFMVANVVAKMRGQAYPAINDSDFALLPLPLPPLAEQNRIVAKLDELMELCDRLEMAHAERERCRERLSAASLYRLNNSVQASNFREHARFYLNYLARIITRPEQISALRQTILKLAMRGKLVQQDPRDEPAFEVLIRLRERKEQQIKERKVKHESPLPNINQAEAPFELPTGWCWARFPELGIFGRGKSKHRPRNDPSLFEGGTHLLVQTGDVARSNGLITTFTGKYNELGLAQSTKWPKGTLCITIAANIAGSGILSFDACFPDSVVGFIPDPEFSSAQYFEYFIRTAKADLLEFAPATAQKNINLEILNAVLVPLPPLAEQHRIVTKVEELLTLCDQLEAWFITAKTEGSRFLNAILNQALGTRLYQANEQKLGITERGAERQNHIEVGLSEEQMKSTQDLQFTSSNPVRTIEQMLECLTSLGGNALPERLLNVAGLGEDVEKFFDLLREGRDSELLSVPTGANQVIRRDAHAD